MTIRMPFHVESSMTTAPSRFFCSQTAAIEGEPLAGTAPGGIREWLGIELDGGWEPKAIESEGISDALRDVLTHWQTPAHRRVQFLRVRPAEKRHVWLARGGVLWQWPFTDAATLRDEVTGPLPAHAIQVEHPVVWVCTHGKRDMCCARWGMPVYRRLVEVGGIRAAQTSHLGGHRFAATALVLPQGILYGRLSASDAETFTEHAAAGQLWLDKVRGRSALSARAQAAEVAARRAIGRIAEPLRHVHEHDDHVIIGIGGDELRVLTQREAGPELKTSCTASTTKQTSWWRCDVVEE